MLPRDLLLRPHGGSEFEDFAQRLQPDDAAVLVELPCLGIQFEDSEAQKAAAMRDLLAYATGLVERFRFTARTFARVRQCRSEWQI